MSASRQAPSAKLVRTVVLVTIALTLFHFTDNAVNVDDYPKASWQGDSFQWFVVAGWFLFTAVGIAGYRLYAAGRFAEAHVGLILYGLLVMSSLGHFAYGSPSELSTHGVISVFVDALAGATVIGVALWSLLVRQRQPRSEHATPA